MTYVVLALLAACAAPEPESAEPAPIETELAPAPIRAEPATASSWEPSEAEEKLVTALSVRHPEPTCAELEPLVPDPVTSYRSVIAHVPMPPWVGMRAATCLLETHPADAEPDALRWIADPEAAGLATLVAGRIDTLPRPTAKRVVEAGLAGPHAAVVRARAAAARDPEIRSLATPAP